MGESRSKVALVVSETFHFLRKKEMNQNIAK